ncbi:MAG: glutamine synthetase type III, partial [Clostridia bacterium]|nr:glutamine synthetase type III [Clostridia bacterium]
LNSRCEIMLENYCKTVTIEANTMIDMARTQIAPAVERFCSDLARNAAAKKALDTSVACIYETELVKKLADLTDRIAARVNALQNAVIALHDAGRVIDESVLIRDGVLPRMCELRLACDEAETLTEKTYWPFPTYADILFSVR